MDLQMSLKNVKFIKEYKLSLPISKGLYAITGENASGKSTIISCASTLFYKIPMYEYFGKPQDESKIELCIDNEKYVWCAENNVWRKRFPSKLPVGGFFEGSIIYGNRFKNTYFSVIQKLDHLNTSQMYEADDFIRKNLGSILHNNPNHYKKLYRLKGKVAEENHLSGTPYFYEAHDGHLISQARMSTGENLLVSILNSLNIIKQKREKFSDNRPSLILLDEIEIALHASALRRLTMFLAQAANDLELAIYFSTHSLELIRDIKPQNIFYISKQNDGSLITTNPCYPAFATRNLYSDDGYGNDLVILVEDDLAKITLERILLEKELINNIRIKILPTGGWQNTITMAYDLIKSRLLLKNTKILVVLDRDIKPFVPDFIRRHPHLRDISTDYLPINSLEKYLKLKLLDCVDQKLYTILDNYIFQNMPLSALISKYNNELPTKDLTTEDETCIKNGKRFFNYLQHELRCINKERQELIELVVKHLLSTDSATVETLTNYLEKNIREF